MKTKISKYMLKKLVLNEMAYPSTFNIEVFNNIRTFKGRKEYCDQRLQKIASGSSRIVYKIDDDKYLIIKNSINFDRENLYANILAKLMNCVASKTTENWLNIWKN